VVTQPTLPGIAPAPAPAPETIALDVKCIPKGQPRLKSAARIQKGAFGPVAFVHHYTPDTADAFKRAVQLAANRYSGRRHAGPVQLDLTAYFPRTEKKLIKGRGLVEIDHAPGAPPGPIPMTAKPDRDNLDKVVLDALTEIGLWIDDAQVYAGRLAKFWCAAGSPPGVRIVITLEPWLAWKKQPKAKKTGARS
jgi:Holliday junction resolvase RusA-like endonuclease